MRHLVAVIAFLVLAVPALADGMTAADVYKASVPSVMVLTVAAKDGKTYIGTGFVAFKDGLAVAAWHVVKDAVTVTAKFNDGQEFEVSGLIDSDPKRDIALVHVKEFGRKPLTLSATPPEIGGKAYVIGAPEGLEFTVSDGIVSQIRQDDGINFYQYTCPTSHGNSGGPVFNDKGEVIAIVKGGLESGQNLNFGMPSTYVLGLDSTLPTKPWDEVKVARPSNEAGASQTDPKDDRTLGYAIEVRHDIGIFLSYFKTTVVAVKNGYKNGPGSEAFQIQSNISKIKDDLANVDSSDPVRKRMIAATQSGIDSALNAITDYIQAVVEAQNSGGWTALSRDLMQRCNAETVNAALADSDDLQALLKDPSFRTNVPRLCKDFDGDLSSPPSKVGTYIPLLDPVLIGALIPGGMADKVGLQIGDRVISINSEDVDNGFDIRSKLIANMGNKVRISVYRDGKQKSWDATVPGS